MTLMKNLLQQLNIDTGLISEPLKAPILAIMGPTASGKSSLAMQLAELLPVEIISADSMQVYRGMDIGVAKPTLEEQRKVPHHLLDICEICDSLDVFQYVKLAEKAICEIRNRKKIPLLVGGSGMYIRALFYGLDPLPADSDLRKILDEKYDSEESFEKLKDLMSVKDPEDFKRWEKHRRKLIRALEVFTLTGKSITQLQKTWEGKLRFPVKTWRLSWEREILREKVLERTDDMLADGWIAETEKLIAKGFLDSPTARQAIGYNIIADFLQEKIDRATMRTKIINSTRQFARRQDTWFKNKHPEALELKMPMGLLDKYAL
jgi:tRNA dimethylallyltransferase